MPRADPLGLPPANSARSLDPQGLSQPPGALLWVNTTPVISLLGLAWGRSRRRTVLLDQRRKFEAEDQMSLKGLGKRRGSSQLVPRTRIPRARREAKKTVPGEHKCSRDFAKVWKVRR